MVACRLKIYSKIFIFDTYLLKRPVKHAEEGKGKRCKISTFEKKTTLCMSLE